MIGVIIGTGWDAGLRKGLSVPADNIFPEKRVHHFEDPAGVDRQIERLVKDGCDRFVLTAAVGSLDPQVEVGEIYAVDGFVSVFAPQICVPPFTYVSPEDALVVPDGFPTVGHVMVPGPFFEGRKYDKKFLASTGAKVVGMSLLPEMVSIARFGCKAICLVHVTNDMFEEHSHETNVERSLANTETLVDALSRAFEQMYAN